MHGTPTDTTILSFLALYIVASRDNSLAKPTFLRPSKLGSPYNTCPRKVHLALKQHKPKKNTLVSGQCSKANNGVGGRTSGNLALARFFFSFLSHSHRSLSKTSERTQNSEVYVYEKKRRHIHTHTHARTKPKNAHCTTSKARRATPKGTATQKNEHLSLSIETSAYFLFLYLSFALNAFLSNRMGKRCRCHGGSLPSR